MNPPEQPLRMSQFGLAGLMTGTPNVVLMHRGFVDGSGWQDVPAARRCSDGSDKPAIGRTREFAALAERLERAQRSLLLVADEHAALRRVARLIVQGVPAAALFSAVSDEVDALFDCGAGVLRFEEEPPAVVFAGVSKRIQVGIGTRLEFEGGMAAAVATTARRIGCVASIASPIVVDGRLWGTVNLWSTEGSLPPDTPERLERFTELVATAIANAAIRSELAASRRRIVAASDDARRRIERDLHDGTQQRLVSLALALRATEANVPPELDGMRSELSQIASGLADAVVELQEITRGIHPPSLEQCGLRAALRTLARRSPIPVELNIAIEGRLPESIEVAAYYVASEALANAAKHAHATGIEMSLARHGDCLIMSIRDDGIGGADPAWGSGLVGLTDRVEALGGSLEVRSPAGQGTRLTATLPLDAEFAAALV